MKRGNQVRRVRRREGRKGWCSNRRFGLPRHSLLVGIVRCPWLPVVMKGEDEGEEERKKWKREKKEKKEDKKEDKEKEGRTAMYAVSFRKKRASPHNAGKVAGPRRPDFPERCVLTPV